MNTDGRDHKRALMVGIDHYSGQPLTGCVADMEVMAKLLQTGPDHHLPGSGSLVHAEAACPRTEG